MANYGTYADVETGEVIQGLFISAEQLEAREAYKEQLKRQEQARGNTYKFYYVDQINFKGVADMGLTNKQLGQYLMLATYADFDGTLLKSTHDKTPLYTLTDWGKVLGVTYQTAGKLKDTLISVELMYETTYTDDTGQLHKAVSLYDRYIYKGRMRSNSVVKVYRTSLRTLYKEQGASNVGVLGRLLPYVNYNNVLCFDYADTHALQPLKVKDMAKLIGRRADDAGKIIKGFTYDGRNVIAKEIVDGKQVYKVDAFLAYRQTGHITDTMETVETTTETELKVTELKVTDVWDVVDAVETTETPDVVAMIKENEAHIERALALFA